MLGDPLGARRAYEVGTGQPGDGGSRHRERALEIAERLAGYAPLVLQTIKRSAQRPCRNRPPNWPTRRWAISPRWPPARTTGKASRPSRKSKLTSAGASTPRRPCRAPGMGLAGEAPLPRTANTRRAMKRTQRGDKKEKQARRRISQTCPDSCYACHCLSRETKETILLCKTIRPSFLTLPQTSIPSTAWLRLAIACYREYVSVAITTLSEPYRAGWIEWDGRTYYYVCGLDAHSALGLGGLQRGHAWHAGRHRPGRLSTGTSEPLPDRSPASLQRDDLAVLARRMPAAARRHRAVAGRRPRFDPDPRFRPRRPSADVHHAEDAPHARVGGTGVLARGAEQAVEEGNDGAGHRFEAARHRAGRALAKSLAVRCNVVTRSRISVVSTSGHGTKVSISVSRTMASAACTERATCRRCTCRGEPSRKLAQYRRQVFDRAADQPVVVLQVGQPARAGGRVPGARLPRRCSGTAGASPARPPAGRPAAARGRNGGAAAHVRYSSPRCSAMYNCTSGRKARYSRIVAGSTLCSNQVTAMRTSPPVLLPRWSISSPARCNCPSTSRACISQQRRPLRSAPGPARGARSVPCPPAVRVPAWTC